jgi:hypothetical protein
MKRYNARFLTFHLPILYPVSERLPSILTEPASRPLNDLAAVQTNVDRVHLGDGVDARTGLGVKIAIADSGLDLTHADIPAPAEKYDMIGGATVQRTVWKLTSLALSEMPISMPNCERWANGKACAAGELFLTMWWLNVLEAPTIFYGEHRVGAFGRANLPRS